jgi:hypothetical protein
MESVPAQPFESRVASVGLRLARLALRALIVFAIAAGTLAGLAWAAQRWLGWSLPPAITNVFLERVQAAEALLYAYDNDTGWRANPYTQLRHATRGPFQRGEPHDVRLRTNSEGFFDREHYATSPYYRIAFVGDSWVEAQQVEATQRFTHLVEEYVHGYSKGAKAVETMNFGWSNLGTAQEVGVVRKYVARYRPDEIWVVFNPVDDVSDSSALFTAPPLGPTFTYGDRGAITDVRFGNPHPPVVSEAMRRERYREWADLSIAQVMPFFYATESHPAFEAAFAEMRACFRLLVKEAGASRVTLLYMPPRRELSRGEWEAYVAVARKATGRPLQLDPANAERRIAAMAREESVDFVSLRGLMAEKGVDEMYQDHLSRMGHHWVAAFIAHRLIAGQCCAPPRRDPR